MRVSYDRGLSIVNFDISKYAGLELSEEFARLSRTLDGQEKIKNCCNGVGSEVGLSGKLTYHLIPNTVWFLDITCCSDIHDVDYTYPEVFTDRLSALRHKEESDARFYRNLLFHIKRNGGNSVVLYLRNRRASIYYDILRRNGVESYMSGKKILNG